MGDYDIGYKRLFSEPVMVRDLLEHFVREDWVAALDFSTLERVNQDLVTPDGRERRCDTVWRVRFQGEWLYVLLLLEFQSSVERFMAVRVMVYVALLLHDLEKTGQLTPTGRLPLVLPLVLYNGDDRWTAPLEVQSLIEPVPGGLSRYVPSLTYLLIDESAYDEAELNATRSFCAALFELERSPTPRASLRAVRKAVQWCVATNQVSLAEAFARFFERLYVGRDGIEAKDITGVDPQERYAMLAKNIQRWAEEFKAEGEAKGEAKGKAAMLIRLIEGRLGPLDAQQLRRVLEADQDALDLWSDRFLEARNLNDIFG